MQSIRGATLCLATTATLAGFAGGCGDQTQQTPSADRDESQIRSTVLAWYAATARADGAQACALMTPQARQRESGDGPEVAISQDGHFERIPRTCAARLTRSSKAGVVDSGVAPAVNHATVTKVDILDGRATVRVRLGKGDQLMAVTSSGGRWLISGFVTG